ncbi:MAG: homocysteine S-methyltransferase family protein, partial [Phycisphaerales bacterium JB037]
MTSPLLRAISERILILDGAMGTSIHGLDLSLEHDYCGCENCSEILVRTRPDEIEKIHRTFLEAGADAVETDSFGAMPHVLAEFDLQDDAFKLSKQSAEVARAACDAIATTDRPRFALGSLGPGTKLVTLGQIDWQRLIDSYTVAARGLIAGGVDALLLETCQDLLQVKAGINACLAALDAEGKTPDDIPIMVSLTIETTGTMLVGSSIEAALSALRRYPIASVGLNCATGPTEMAEHLQHLSKFWRGPVSCVPNAGLPVMVEGRTEYPLKPRPFADALAKFVD